MTDILVARNESQNRKKNIAYVLFLVTFLCAEENRALLYGSETWAVIASEMIIYRDAEIIRPRNDGDGLNQN